MSRLMFQCVVLSALVAGILVSVYIYWRNRSERIRLEMRKLWADHVFYTREFLFAVILSTSNVDSSKNRLLQNQVDIGKAFGKYRGTKVGDELSSLLTDHIMLAVPVVQALSDPDHNAMKTAMSNWKANADKISAYIHKYTGVDMHDMFQEHLALTAEEASDIYNKKYGDSVAVFDRILEGAYSMADDMWKGCDMAL